MKGVFYRAQRLLSGRAGNRPGEGYCEGCVSGKSL